MAKKPTDDSPPAPQDSAAARKEEGPKQPLARRDEKGHFLKGVSGNPGGRPKGVAERARELTGGDGTELLEFWRSVYTNPTEKTPDRLAASKLFAERLWGKAVEITAVANVSDVSDGLRNIAADLLLNLAKGDPVRLMQRIDALPSPEPENPLDVLQHGEKVGDGEKDPA